MEFLEMLVRVSEIVGDTDLNSDEKLEEFTAKLMGEEVGGTTGGNILT